MANMLLKLQSKLSPSEGRGFSTSSLMLASLICDAAVLVQWAQRAAQSRRDIYSRMNHSPYHMKIRNKGTQVLMPKELSIKNLLFCWLQLFNPLFNQAKLFLQSPCHILQLALFLLWRSMMGHPASRRHKCLPATTAPSHLHSSAAATGF